MSIRYKNTYATDARTDAARGHLLFKRLETAFHTRTNADFQVEDQVGKGVSRLICLTYHVLRRDLLFVYKG